MVSYRPIDCGFHDRLQLASLRGRPVPIRYRTPGGRTVSTTDRIVDVYSRAAAEYLRTASGAEIRLDRILSVDGHLLPAGTAPDEKEKNKLS